MSFSFVRSVSPLAVALALAACGRSSSNAAVAAAVAAAAPAAQPAHCDNSASLSQCREYRGVSVSIVGADTLRSLCTATSGTFATGPCPTAELVGTCETPEHLERYYSRGSLAYTAQTAQAACAGGLSQGTFRAGP